MELLLVPVPCTAILSSKCDAPFFCCPSFFAHLTYLLKRCVIASFKTLCCCCCCCFFILSLILSFILCFYVLIIVFIVIFSRTETCQWLQIHFILSFCVLQINVLQSKRRSEILKSVSMLCYISVEICSNLISSLNAKFLFFFFSTDVVLHVCSPDILPPRIWPLQWTATSHETARRTGTGCTTRTWICLKQNVCASKYNLTCHQNKKLQQEHKKVFTRYKNAKKQNKKKTQLNLGLTGKLDAHSGMDQSWE